MYLRSAAYARRFRLSKLLFESGLFEHGVRGMPRFDLAINRNVPPGRRAVPDFVIAFAGANEVTTRSTQDTPQLGREVRHGRRRVFLGWREFVLSRNQLERHTLPWLASFIQLKQLRNHLHEFPLHFFERCCFRSEPRHIGLSDVPYAGFGVPKASDGIGLGTHICR
jgi:hypothetical protein